MTERELKIVSKICNEKEGIGFAQFLIWASGEKIDNADAVASRLASAGKLRVDYVQGLYFSA